ncbi:hypothetical protein ATANTOWER_012409 [Ataeniobius toweri]|uniref:Uncharacterized protein n=1 Tax=Ataeniobius toweri TaxID=208326 RepID=A0ABU7AB16_9TELE|nr:hypothetical protein [Ataeniobius toweri]
MHTSCSSSSSSSSFCSPPRVQPVRRSLPENNIQIRSDASVQRDSGAFPRLLLLPGSEHPQRRTDSSPGRETVIRLRPQVHL